MRTLLTFAPMLGSLCLSGCAGLRAGGGGSGSHPEPNSPPGFATGAGYVKDGRDWYQLRVKLGLPDQYWENGSLDRVQLDAVANLWRYNRRSKNYDIPVGGRALARLGLAFTFDSIAGGDLRILPTSGTNGSGRSGLDGKDLKVAIDFARSPDPQSPDGQLLVVNAIAALDPSDIGERNRLGTLATAKVRRTWKIDIDATQKVRLEELP